MKCEKCQSENVITIEEQGEFYLKKKYVPITPIIIVTFTIILLYVINMITSILGDLTKLITIIAIFDLLLIILAIVNSTLNYKMFHKKWIKKSRTKFTCLDCGNQWYVVPTDKEILK